MKKLSMKPTFQEKLKITYNHGNLEVNDTRRNLILAQKVVVDIKRGKSGAVGPIQKNKRGTSFKGLLKMAATKKAQII